MTEFAQQVADALQAGAPSLALEDHWNLLDRLAPRVATAIEIALGGWEIDEKPARQAALQALRGSK